MVSYSEGLDKNFILCSSLPTTCRKKYRIRFLAIPTSSYICNIAIFANQEY
nr:MAG TPA: hypothetical protein [Caudoviricetes sp.]